MQTPVSLLDKEVMDSSSIRISNSNLATIKDLIKEVEVNSQVQTLQWEATPNSLTSQTFSLTYLAWWAIFRVCIHKTFRWISMATLSTLMLCQVSLSFNKTISISNILTTIIMTMGMMSTVQRRADSTQTIHLLILRNFNLKRKKMRKNSPLKRSETLSILMLPLDTKNLRPVAALSQVKKLTLQIVRSALTSSKLGKWLRP